MDDHSAAIHPHCLRQYMRLGVEATKWACNAGRLAVALEDRLFDLVWEWDCYSRLGVACTTGRLAAVEWEIVDLAQKVFRGGTRVGDDHAFTPHDIVQLVEDLHDSGRLVEMGFPAGAPPVPALSERRNWLLRHYLTDRAVFDNGHQTKWIDPSQECDALENLQTDLRRRLGRIGISVEVNPSSNLLIGNMGDFEHHPFWRLRPPRGDQKQPPLSICIGSDDPLTFAADLPTEYMLLHDALVLGKFSCDEADQWLDAVRETGWRTRFTIPREQPTPLQRSIHPVPTDGLPLPPLAGILARFPRAAGT